LAHGLDAIITAAKNGFEKRSLLTEGLPPPQIKFNQSCNIM